MSLNILPAYLVCQANSVRLINLVCSVPVRLMNTSSLDIELQAGQKVSEFCPPYIASDGHHDNSNLCCSTTLPSMETINELKNALSTELSLRSGYWQVSMMGYGSFVGCLLGFLMVMQPFKELLKLFCQVLPMKHVFVILTTL